MTVERIIYHGLGRATPTLASVFSVLDCPPSYAAQTRTERKQVGMVLGAFGITDLPTADPSPIFVRASNLANVVTLALRFTRAGNMSGNVATNDGDIRRAMLTSLTSPEFTTSVLGLAAQFGGNMGLEVATRASLAMHFLIGILQFESGVDTIYTRAYARAVGMYRKQEQRAQADTLRGVRLGAVQNCRINPDDGKPYWDWDPRKALCEAANAVQQVQQSAVKAGEDVGRALEKAFNWTGDAVVAGLKWMFGEKVGGFIGSLFKTFLGIIKSFLDSFGELLKAIGNAVLKTVELLLRGDFLGAAKNFFREITAALFVIPPIGPILAGLLGVTVAEVAEMGRRVADRAPLFIANVASAVLGIVTPTPQAISNVVGSLRPGIAVFGGAAVVKVTTGRGLKGLGAIPTAQAEASVDSVVAFGIGAVNGVVQAAEFANNLANSIAGSIGGVGGPDLVTKIEIQFRRIELAFKEMNFKKIIDSIMEFFKGTPEISGQTVKQGPPTADKVVAQAKSLSPAAQADAATKLVEALRPRDRARLLAAKLRATPKNEVPILREEFRRAGFKTT